MEIIEVNRSVVLNMLGAVGRGDFDGAMECFAENATFWVPGNMPFSGTLRGRQEIYDKNFLPSEKLSVPGSVKVEIGRTVSEGSYVAAEWVFMRKTVQGRDYRNVFFGLFEVRGEKIQSVREYLDTQYAMDLLWPNEEPTGRTSNVKEEPA